MPSNEGHVHFEGVTSTVAFLDQELSLAMNVEGDPIGAMRIKAVGFEGVGLYLPSEGWENIPGTSPVLQARVDGHYPLGYIRMRQA